MAHLHHAMCVGMVMDCTAFPRAPYKNELDELAKNDPKVEKRSIAAYQVTFAIPLVNQVPSVCPTRVTQRI